MDLTVYNSQDNKNSVMATSKTLCKTLLIFTLNCITKFNLIITVWGKKKIIHTSTLADEKLSAWITAIAAVYSEHCQLGHAQGMVKPFQIKGAVLTTLHVYDSEAKLITSSMPGVTSMFGLWTVP